MAKTKRRNCDYCGEQYRYSRSTSRTCGGSCRNRLNKRARILEPAAQPPANAPGRDYTVLARKQKPVEPEVAQPKSDKEALEDLMKQVLPNGVSREARTRPPVTQQVGPPAYIIIHNVPTRFPGTPPSRGRQLMP